MAMRTAYLADHPGRPCLSNSQGLGKQSVFKQGASIYSSTNTSFGNNNHPDGVCLQNARRCQRLCSCLSLPYHRSFPTFILHTYPHSDPHTFWTSLFFHAHPSRLCCWASAFCSFRKCSFRSRKSMFASYETHASGWRSVILLFFPEHQDIRDPNNRNFGCKLGFYDQHKCLCFYRYS